MRGDVRELEALTSIVDAYIRNYKNASSASFYDGLVARINEHKELYRELYSANSERPAQRLIGVYWYICVKRHYMGPFDTDDRLSTAIWILNRCSEDQLTKVDLLSGMLDVELNVSEKRKLESAVISSATRKPDFTYYVNGHVFFVYGDNVMSGMSDDTKNEERVIREQVKTFNFDCKFIRFNLDDKTSPVNLRSRDDKFEKIKEFYIRLSCFGAHMVHNMFLYTFSEATAYDPYYESSYA